jgi:hypothetical protein
MNTPRREHQPIDWRPGKLWSLWDIMHKIRAAEFFKAYERVSTYHQMLVFMEGRTPPVTPAVTRIDHDNLIERLTLLNEELTALGMVSCTIGIKHAIEILKACPLGDVINGEQRVNISPPDVGRLRNYLGQATSRIADDFALQTLLVISPSTLSYYEQPKLFGDIVFTNFSSANDDITEAGTCFALGRGTACVMHLMRVLEAGLNALVNVLQVNTKDDWGSKIRDVNIALSARATQKGPKLPDDEFYAEAAAQFEFLKRAWRNPSMHLDRSYSIARAEEILLAVKSFMAVLATKLSE